MRNKKEKKKSRNKKPRPTITFIPDFGPSQVLTVTQWCALNAISYRSGRRILKSPNGPVVTQLTNQRIGITRKANEAWRAARDRSAA